MLPGVQRMQQPTIDGSGKSDGRPEKESHDSGWQRLATGDGGRRQKCRQSATRVVGSKEGDGSKSDGNDKKGGGRAMAMTMAMATTRAMVRVVRVADKEGYVQGGESDGNGEGKDDGDCTSNGNGDGNGNRESKGAESDNNGEEEGKGNSDGDN